MNSQSLIAFLCTTLLLAAAVQAESRTVIVGFNNDPPLNFSEQGSPVKGVFVDLINYVAKKENWVVEYRECDWGNCLELLKTAEIDLLTTIARTEQRATLYDFTTEPVLSNWGVIYLRRGRELDSTLELADRKIGVLKGDVYYTYFRELGEKFDIVPQYVEAGSYGEVLDLIEAGTVDGGIFSRLFGKYHELVRHLPACRLFFARLPQLAQGKLTDRFQQTKAPVSINVVHHG